LHLYYGDLTPLLSLWHFIKHPTHHGPWLLLLLLAPWLLLLPRPPRCGGLDGARIRRRPHSPTSQVAPAAEMRKRQGGDAVDATSTARLRSKPKE
jgi:hypothetical protein